MLGATLFLRVNPHRKGCLARAWPVVRSAVAKAMADTLRDNRMSWLASRSFSEGWWRGLDSNQRTLARADLQSAAFNHSATSPRCRQARHLASRLVCVNAGDGDELSPTALLRQGYGGQPSLPTVWLVSRSSGGAKAVAPSLALRALQPVTCPRHVTVRLERVKGIEPSS